MFLVVGDIHIKHDNGEDIDLLLVEIKKVVQENKIQNIVLLGDILHTHEKIFSQCLNKACFFIDECSKLCLTYVLVGNHDMYSNSVFLTEDHWMNILKEKENIKIVDSIYEKDGVIFAPYVFSGRFIEALRTKFPDDSWKTKKLIFAHQEFKGCNMGAIVSEHGDEWDESYPHVISGHIHDNQTVGIIYYVGAPLQHSFGDSVKRVLCIVHEDFSRTEIPLSISKKLILHGNIENIENIKDLALNAKKHLEKNETIKIKLDSTKEEFKLFKNTDEYKNLTNSGIIFQVVSKKSVEKKESSNVSSFHAILEEIIIEDDDENLYDLYNEILFNRMVISLE